MDIKRLTAYLAATILCCIFNPAVVKADADSSYIKAKIKIEKIIPEVQVDSITNSEIDGLLQVNSGSEVFYISKDSNYLVYGELIDLNKPKESWHVTENHRKIGRLKLIGSIDKKSMIIFSPKNKKATVTVFTDIDCSFCRRMQKDMGKLNDLGIEIRYIAFPRTGPKSESYKKAVNVWCSEDKNKSMSLAKQGGAVAEASCSNPVNDHFRLGIKMGITGTPTLIFEDGTMLASYLPPEKLLEASLRFKPKRKP